jgi:hypothetical protein
VSREQKLKEEIDKIKICLDQISHEGNWEEVLEGLDEVKFQIQRLICNCLPYTEE